MMFLVLICSIFQSDTLFRRETKGIVTVLITTADKLHICNKETNKEVKYESSRN